MQHEFDHLDGILYVDRLDDSDWKTVQKIARKRGWGRPGSIVDAGNRRHRGVTRAERARAAPDQAMKNGPGVEPRADPLLHLDSNQEPIG